MCLPSPACPGVSGGERRAAQRGSPRGKLWGRSPPEAAGQPQSPRSSRGGGPGLWQRRLPPPEGSAYRAGLPRSGGARRSGRSGAAAPLEQRGRAALAPGVAAARCGVPLWGGSPRSPERGSTGCRLSGWGSAGCAASPGRCSAVPRLCRARSAPDRARLSGLRPERGCRAAGVWEGRY